MTSWWQSLPPHSSSGALAGSALYLSQRLCVPFQPGMGDAPQLGEVPPPHPNLGRLEWMRWAHCPGHRWHGFQAKGSTTAGPPRTKPQTCHCQGEATPQTLVIPGHTQPEPCPHAEFPLKPQHLQNVPVPHISSHMHQSNQKACKIKGIPWDVGGSLVPPALERNQLLLSRHAIHTCIHSVHRDIDGV